ETGQPRARRDDHPVRTEVALGGRERHAASAGRPSGNALTHAELGAALPRAVEEGRDAFLGEHHARAVLQQAGPFLARAVGREPSLERRLVQHVVLDVVLARGPQRAAEQLALLRADPEASRLHEETLTALGLELVPQLVRAPHQWYVQRMLVVRL